MNREPVTEALQSYADRGVFRGFRATASRGGRVDYEFAWLTRQPMSATFDPRRRLLTFQSLFPGVDKHVANDLKSIVTSRGDRDQPAHKRLDARRARITGGVRAGDFRLSVEIRGRNHEYAVRQSLNLINELFVALHQYRPDYLSERFGVSAE